MGVDEWTVPKINQSGWIHCPFNDVTVPRSQIGQHLVSCLNAPWYVWVRDGDFEEWRRTGRKIPRQKATDA